MGNQPSNSSPRQEGAPSSQRPANALQQNIRNLLRPPGGLGLSKAELDKRCQPSGLYPSCQWDDKAIRRLIGDGRLASRGRGTELRTSPADTECPICFLHHPEMNVTKCCQAGLCTECYLQVRPQRSTTTPCPFCNATRLQVAVAKTMDPKAIQRRAEEEQLVIEAKIRERADHVQQQQQQQQQNLDSVVGDDDHVTDIFDPLDREASRKPINSAASSMPPLSPHGGQFGSSLAQDNRVASIRARSESFASESSSHNMNTESLVQDITALAMTPEERATLESEVRVQQLHPLAQRMEAEQMTRRLQNQQDYYRSQAGRLRELRARRELVSRTFGSTGLGSPAMSSRDQSMRGSVEWNRLMNAHGALRGGGDGADSLDEMVVLEAALMLSLEEDAQQRVRDASNDASESEHSNVGGPGANSATADLASHVSNMMRALQAPRVSGSSSATAANSNILMNSASTLNLSSILSEEEQIAIAIAASLTESGTSTPAVSSPSTGLDSATTVHEYSDSGRDASDLQVDQRKRSAYEE